MLNVTFYGVRGSTPCSGAETSYYGGNTACVLLEVANEPPIICDLGTGVTYLGRDLLARPGAESTPFCGTALVSHLHWDHIQGIPFFKPLLAPGAELDIYGPRQIDSSIETEFGRHIRPPVFPVTLNDLPGTVRYRDVEDETLTIGSARVHCFSVPHVGPTNGYRIDVGRASVAFICDHQQPSDGSLNVPDEVVAACAGVDVLIHDSQYDDEEFAQRSDWGHCTPDFALELARRAGARRLVMFHHDPGHDDAWVTEQVCRIQGLAGDEIEVIGAREGLALSSGD